MKMKFLVLSVLALTVVALTTADASAWGWWRYRSTCNSGPRFHWFGRHNNCCYQPYNAFTPRPNCCQPNFGYCAAPAPHRFGGHIGHRHGAAPVDCAPADGCCLAAPVMQQSIQSAQHIDPSLLPYLHQSAQMPMEMPVQTVSYQLIPYGMQPGGFVPMYYQPYPTYYYPQQTAYPNYGYGY